MIEDVDDTDVCALLDASKDFVIRHTAVLKERLSEKLQRAELRYRGLKTLAQQF